MFRKKFLEVNKPIKKNQSRYHSSSISGRNLSEIEVYDDFPDFSKDGSVAVFRQMKSMKDLDGLFEQFAYQGGEFESNLFCPTPRNKRKKRGIDLSSSKDATSTTSNNDNNNKQDTTRDDVNKKRDKENYEEKDMECDVEILDNPTQMSKETTHEIDYLDVDTDDKTEYLDPISQFSYQELESDLDNELTNVFQGVRDEVQILTKNLENNKNLLNQNYEKLSQLELDSVRVNDEVYVYSELLKNSNALFLLVNTKFTDLLTILNRIKDNRIEENEYLLRMRRWLYCDFLRMSGVNELDYRCGDIEDTDEMGKDLSITVEKNYEKRIQNLNKFKDEFIKTSLYGCSKYKFKTLENYLIQPIRDLFTFKLGSNYSLVELSRLYDYELNLEEVNLKLMGDISEKYKEISTPLQVFVDFRKNNSNEYELFQFTKIFKIVFVFYAKLSLVTWDPLKDNNPEKLDWFKAVKQFDPNLLPEIVEEVLYPHCLDCIEYFDIESYEQCNNLANFMKFVISNLSSDSTLKCVDKLVSTLMDSLKTKVSVLSFKISSQDSLPTSSLISDPVVLNMLKFLHLNLISSVLCFSYFISDVTLTAVFVDTLFLDNLLPFLNFESKLDAFLVLNFKMIISPLKNIFRYETKNNSIIKLTFRRFCESDWDNVEVLDNEINTDTDIFNSLLIPMDKDKYTQLMDF